MSEMSIRNKKMMLAGLFLSKFNEEGYEALGYTSFNEAFHSLAAIVGGPWRSVKQYRDEFDVAFDNGRAGWRNRAMHPTRTAFLTEFGGMSLDEFTELVQTQLMSENDVDLALNRAVVAAGVRTSSDESFAKRMLTGRAAENFFEQHYHEVPRFDPCDLKRTTDLGCGFDFKLSPPAESFLGVEVKGLREREGQIQLTEKEFKMAGVLKNRFYLYVVTNFARSPKPQVIEDPLSAGISFEERVIESTQRVWVAQIAAA